MLLIDEIDRADDDFEAFLLELLADAAVTIPEIGTIGPLTRRSIVLTSNRTRDLHDAVKRRCLYHWIDYPSPQREVEIVRRRVKGASEVLAVQVADAVARIREQRRPEAPGVAEAIDWVAALDLLGVEELDEAAVERTLGSVLKYSEDQEVIRAAGLETSSRDDRHPLHRPDAPARPAGARRRLQPPPPRRRCADHGRARSAVRAGAGTGQADQPASALLDRARGPRVGPVAGQGIRLVFFSVFGARELPPEFEPEDVATSSAPDRSPAPESRGETGGVGAAGVSSSSVRLPRGGRPA